LSAPKKSSFGFFTSSGLMQWRFESLRCFASSCFILSAYCGGIPGTFISSTETFDSHSPGWTIVLPVVAIDCCTAVETWLPLALCRSTSGPLLHAARVRIDAATQITGFIIKPPLIGRADHKADAGRLPAKAAPQLIC